MVTKTPKLFFIPTMKQNIYIGRDKKIIAKIIKKLEKSL